MRCFILTMLLLTSLACSPYPVVTFTVTMLDGTTRIIDGERFSWYNGCVSIYDSDGGSGGRAVATFCGVKEVSSTPKKAG